MLLLQVLTDGLVLGSIYALGALGFSLIYGTTGTFHIAFGATMAIAVYVATAIGTAGSALVLGILLGAGLAAAIGVATYLGFYRPMVFKGRSRVLVFVASLGLTTMVEALLLIVFGEQQRRFELGGLLDARQVLGQNVSWLGLIAIAVGILALLGLALLTRRTGFGRRVRAISMNPELAETIGIGTTMVTAAVYAIGSLLGFFALLMLTSTTAVSSDVGTSFTLIVAVAVIAGGVGNLYGSYAVAIGFGLVQSTAAVYLSGQWTLVLVYGTFILLMMIRPSGLFPGSARS